MCLKYFPSIQKIYRAVKGYFFVARNSSNDRMTFFEFKIYKKRLNVISSLRARAH